MELDFSMCSAHTKRCKKTRRGKRKHFSGNNVRNDVAYCDENKHQRLEKTENGMCDLISDITKTTCSPTLLKKSKSRKNKGLLRPRYSPKAPKNYTSYIMDDHIANADGHFRYTFESPDSTFGRNDLVMCSTDYIEEPGSGHLVNNSYNKNDLDLDFIQKDFENMYNASRTEEISKLSKCELIEDMLKMEDQVVCLLTKLEQVDKSPQNKESIKHSFQKLLIENERLKTENEKMKSLLSP